MKKTLYFYTRNGCHLCVEAKKIILEVKDICDFQYVECDIETNDDWTEKYGLMIPVVEIDHQVVQYGHVDKKYILDTLTENNV